MKTQIIVLLALAAGTVIAQQGCEERQEPPTAADFIARLDTDGDGLVSKTEFDGPAKHFSQFDANGDGYISAEEAPAGPPPGGRKPGPEQSDKPEAPPPQGDGDQPAPPPCEKGSLITRLDVDGDGLVSASEFDGPEDVFEHLDSNADGYISEEEAKAAPPPAGHPHDRHGSGAPEEESPAEAE